MNLYYILHISFLIYSGIIGFQTSSFIYTIHNTLHNTLHNRLEEQTNSSNSIWIIYSTISIIDYVIPSYFLRFLWWYILLHPEYHPELTRIIITNSQQFQMLCTKIIEYYTHFIVNERIKVNDIIHNMYKNHQDFFSKCLHSIIEKKQE